MIGALQFVLEAWPNAIDPSSRTPYEWVRMERRRTVDALVARGLVEATYRDHPDGWKGKLTSAGLAARAAALELVAP